MELLDVNVVLAADRDDHPHFEPARVGLDRVLSTGEHFSVIDLVAGAFVRLATNRRIFVAPSSIEEAFAYVRALRGQPGHVTVCRGRRHLELFESLCRSADATRDLAPDAQIAAIAVDQGGQVIAFDRDFARFTDVRWARPA